MIVLITNLTIKKVKFMENIRKEIIDIVNKDNINENDQNRLKELVGKHYYSDGYFKETIIRYLSYINDVKTLKQIFPYIKEDDKHILSRLLEDNNIKAYGVDTFYYEQGLKSIPEKENIPGKIELFNALLDRNINEVDSILKKYPELINEKYLDFTPLTIAMMCRCNLEMIKLLLSKDNINFLEGSNNDNALLIVPECYSGNNKYKVINELLKNKELRNNKKCMEEALSRTIRIDDIKFIEILIENGVDINSIARKNNLALLNCIVGNKNNKDTIDFLINKTNLSCIVEDEHHRTLLECLLEQKDFEAAKMFLDKEHLDSNSREVKKIISNFVEMAVSSNKGDRLEDDSFNINNIDDSISLMKFLKSINFDMDENFNEETLNKKIDDKMRANFNVDYYFDNTTKTLPSRINKLLLFHYILSFNDNTLTLSYDKDINNAGLLYQQNKTEDNKKNLIDVIVNKINVISQGNIETKEGCLNCLKDGIGQFNDFRSPFKDLIDVCTISDLGSCLVDKLEKELKIEKEGEFLNNLITINNSTKDRQK